jgi:1-pyrroline-5-carboxylate dehydrogenase
VSDKADLKVAVEGAVRSAYGLSGQKCSALSRLYVHESRKKEFIDAFVSRASSLKVGFPVNAETFLGPLVNLAAYQRFERAVADAKSGGGTFLLGGETLKGQGSYGQGHFVQPTLVEIAHTHRVARDEHFAPFVTLHTYKSFDDAIRMANDTEYGLTGGIYSQDDKEVTRFFDEVKAGVLYANRPSGATTGAWPGIQSFCGWKGSGSTGKGGCGPYYVAQFAREQSHTRVL